MGCHKLTYQNQETTSPFMGIWKAGAKEKNSFFSGGTLAKKGQPLKKRDYYYPFGANISALSSTAPLSKPNQFKYNGIEFTDDFDFNVYDAFYRGYDPQIGRWMQIDPKASERESPYVGMGNSPFMYADYLGDTIRDNDGIIKNYRSNVSGQVGQIDKLLGQKGIDDKTKNALELLKGNLNQIVTELDALDASTEVYDFQYTAEANSDGVTYDSESNAVSIKFKKNSSFGLIAQEALHAYQFETGQISISYDNSELGSLYDIGDETATYNREREVSGGAAYRASERVDDQWTIKFGASRTPPAYQNLPRNSRSLYTIEGIMLRLNNTFRNRVGLKPKEVFKGSKR